MTHADWETLARLGFHCEVKLDECEYRPAPHFHYGYYWCQKCYDKKDE